MGKLRYIWCVCACVCEYVLVFSFHFLFLGREKTTVIFSATNTIALKSVATLNRTKQLINHHLLLILRLLLLLSFFFFSFLLLQPCSCFKSSLQKVVNMAFTLLRGIEGYSRIVTYFVVHYGTVHLPAGTVPFYEFHCIEHRSFATFWGRRTTTSNEIKKHNISIKDGNVCLFVPLPLQVQLYFMKRKKKQTKCSYFLFVFPICWQ